MKKIIFLLSISFFISCNSNAQKKETSSSSKTKFPISKTDAEWKQILSKDQYHVLREAGTERPFSSPLNKNYEKGTYHCAACNTPLFKSEHKYDSKSGWPSFDREIKGNVAFEKDSSLGFYREEEHCANCGGHLGHVFNDGPKNTTGKRHCVNGNALKFIPTE